MNGVAECGRGDGNCPLKGSCEAISDPFIGHSSVLPPCFANWEDLHGASEQDCTFYIR